MTDSDKPFVCPVPNCGSRFTNEDHLSVHKAKHEMSLRLKDNQLNKTDFADETPTPTRSVQYCDDVGLFPENPFDMQFRQAATRQSSLPGSLSVDETLGPLHTPNIPSEVTDPEEILPTTAAELNMPLQNIMVHSSSKSIADDTNDSMPFDTNYQSGLMKEEADNTLNTPTAPETPFLSQLHGTKAVTLPTPTTTVIQTPVITSVKREVAIGSATSSLTPRTASVGAVNPVIIQPTVPSVATAVKAAPVSTSTEKPATPAAILVPTGNLVTSTPQMYQIILKLPEGQQIPLNTGASTVVAPVMITKNGLSAAQPSVKMLKQTILQTANTNHKEVDIVKPAQVETTAPLPAADSTTPAKGLGSRRGQRSQENNPEEKRIKLERNCAAAKRCREKKKAEIQSLKLKAQKLEEQNEQFQREVRMLRKQVAELKTHLLAHKNCPVTIQQLAAGQPNVSNLEMIPEVPPTTVPSSNITIFSGFSAAMSTPSSSRSSLAQEEDYIHPLSVQVDVVTSESSNEVDTESNHSTIVSG